MAERLVHRHALSTRVAHWINAVCVFMLLASGLNILYAHPALYWGHDGNSYVGAWLQLPGLADWTWAMLPAERNLAEARRWHFFFAWIFVISGALFLVASLLNGHLRRDLVPRAHDLAPRHLLQDVIDHARLRFPKGVAALSYNSLQRLAYAGVVFVLLPLMLATGLSMSPGFNAIAPWLVDLLGGRQSARTLHFLSAGGIVLFIAVHLLMVVLAGPIHHIRAMITGRLAIDTATDSPTGSGETR